MWNASTFRGNFFEILDSRGNVLQKSLNLGEPLALHPAVSALDHTTYQLLEIGNGQTLRAAVIPFQQAGQTKFLAIAIPTLGTNQVMDTFAKIILFLFPLSVLITARVSALYVGKALAPIAALTQHAASMAKKVTRPQGFWEPLPTHTPEDELGQLTRTFNDLFRGIDCAVRQLRQFVTDASHELRTPIVVLHGETELMLSKPRTAEEYHKTLLVCDDELKKLTRMVEGLFTLSMADAGQLHLECEPLYINEVLEEACALVTSRAGKKDITIVRHLNDEVPCNGDEAFLHQLFLIFLDNAIKYSPENTSIHIALERRDGTIRASFRDHGKGISPEHLPHIFERFYRGGQHASGDSHSGGLGLAIAQAIARAQHGSIECSSSPGVGSTFTVVLPLTSDGKIETLDSSKQNLIIA